MWTHHDRLLVAHMVPWRTQIDVTDDNGVLTYREHFDPDDGVLPWSKPVLRVKHHNQPGTFEVGRCLWADATPLGLDGVFEVDTKPSGDALLEMVDRHGQLPVSVGFRHMQVADVWTPRPDGIPDVRRRNAEVYELAIIPAPAYEWASIRRWGRAGARSRPVEGFRSWGGTLATLDR